MAARHPPDFAPSRAIAAVKSISRIAPPSQPYIWGGAGRQQSPLTEPYFKQINDRYGHAAGDSALRQFSELLSSAVRAGDFVFRYGGEEFLIIVASVDLASIKVVADKLCAVIRKHRFQLLEEAGHVITASLGVALHDGHPDYGRVVDQADRALLNAKEAGRNRWTLFAPDLGQAPRVSEADRKSLE